MAEQSLSLLNPQYGLALHTASADLGLALSNFAGDCRWQSWALGRETSSQLHAYLANFLQPQTWADLQFLAIAKGPGGFTGTRIGVVTGRTLAQALHLPLFAVSTLAAVAWSAVRQDAREEQPAIAVQMPAQRGQLFTAIYQVNPLAQQLTPLLSDQVCSLEQWQQILAALTVPYRLIEVTGGLGDSVLAILELAYFDWKRGDRPHWSTALPFYGQHPVEGH